MMKLQSLSLPSHASATGTRAVHVDQPVAALQICVPKQVRSFAPTIAEFEQLRIAPSSPAEHEQLPVTG